MKLAVTIMALLGTLPAQARTVRVAVCQILSIDGDREGNFRRVEYALEDARAAHADIAAFPESAILGWENPDAHRMATPIPGADSDRIAALAVKYGLMISIGLDEKDGEKLYDSAILVDKTGKLLWKHRKLNVLAWLMDPPYSEGRPEDAGVTDTEFGRIGLVICADAFVDRIARRIEQLAPDLMLVPYGWAAPVDKWPEHAKELEKLVAKRAAQWKCPVERANLRRSQRGCRCVRQDAAPAARSRRGSADRDAGTHALEIAVGPALGEPLGEPSGHRCQKTQAPSQGLKSTTPRPPKSFTLRVTTTRSCSSAVAAMNPSATLSGLPFN
jgi:predicted amidohydrolase